MAKTTSRQGGAAVPPEDGKTAAPRSTAGAQAIDRALAVLFAFTPGQPERRVVELARDLGLNKSTTYRLLQALAGAGLVRRDDAAGTYRLGPGTLDLASRFLGQLDLRTEARPHIEALSREQGESVNLAVRAGDEAISVDYVIGSHALQLVSKLGRRVPLHCSASGKALMLDLDDEQIRQLFADRKLTAYTAHTLTKVDDILKDLPQWRAKGWALNDEETEDGIRAVAAPIRDHSGSVVACISMSAPAFRMDRGRIRELSQAVKTTAAAISQAMGANVALGTHD